MYGAKEPPAIYLLRALSWELGLALADTALALSQIADALIVDNIPFKTLEWIATHAEKASDYVPTYARTLVQKTIILADDYSKFDALADETAQLESIKTKAKNVLAKIQPLPPSAPAHKTSPAI